MREMHGFLVEDFLSLQVGSDDAPVQEIIARLKKAGYDVRSIIREFQSNGNPTWNDRDGYAAREIVYYIDLVSPRGMKEIMKIDMDISYDKLEAEVVGSRETKEIAEQILLEHGFVFDF